MHLPGCVNVEGKFGEMALHYIHWKSRVRVSVCTFSHREKKIIMKMESNRYMYDLHRRLFFIFLFFILVCL